MIKLGFGKRTSLKFCSMKMPLIFDSKLSWSLPPCRCVTSMEAVNRPHQHISNFTVVNMRSSCPRGRLGATRTRCVLAEQGQEQVLVPRSISINPPSFPMVPNVNTNGDFHPISATTVLNDALIQHDNKKQIDEFVKMS